MSGLIQNWCKVIVGRLDEVAPLSETDPLESVGVPRPNGASPAEDHVLQSDLVSGWHLDLFGINFVFDLLFGAKMQTTLKDLGTVFLQSVSTLSSNKQSAKPKTEPCKSPSISKGDIVAVWGTKMISLGFGTQMQAFIGFDECF